MNKWLSLLLLLILSYPVISQDEPPKLPEAPPETSTETKDEAEKPEAEPSPTPPEITAEEQERFDKAIAAPTSAEKAKRLRAFLDEFPSSELKTDAVTYLVTARAMDGNEKLQAGATADGIASFKLAVEDAAMPVSDRLYNDVILKIPLNLFYRDQRAAAFELAQLIEKKVSASPKHLLGLVAFHLGIENGADARRISESAIALDPASPAGWQALGLAHRLNFDIEESVKAYAKAVELDPSSIPAQRSLAEMKRALGKPQEAAAIYRSILAANDKDPAARGGLVMSLFDSGKQAEAEAELAKTLEREPKNFNLLASVAYWYAAHKQGDKAVEHAQKAIDIEPRYVWSHIAMARGLMARKQPVDAERALIKAKQFGNFPTLEYELASARFAAGLFREAAEDLAKTFTVRDGVITTKIGGRVEREANSFEELVAYERRAGILQPAAADDPEASNKLKVLLELNRKVNSSTDEEELSALADEFVKGDDKMKLHRQLHVASLYLQKNVALPKVAELLKASLGNADAGLDVSAPAAAVMASELYESRTIAFSRNEMVLIPDIPRPTLSAILRGRIEELTGWTLYQQKSYPEAAVHLRRAISVLPDKSAWWRSSMWRLGAALEADGKEKEALDSYIKSYKTDRPSALRYAIIESLYKRVHGGIEGLEDQIGPNPVVASVTAPSGQVESSAPAEPAPPETTPDLNTKAVETPATEVKVAAETEKPKTETVVEQVEQKTPVTTEVVQKFPAAVPVDRDQAVKVVTEPKESATAKEESGKAGLPQDFPAAGQPLVGDEPKKKVESEKPTVPVMDPPVKTEVPSDADEEAVEKVVVPEKAETPAVSSPMVKTAEEKPLPVKTEPDAAPTQDGELKQKAEPAAEKAATETVEKAIPENVPKLPEAKAEPPDVKPPVTEELTKAKTEVVPSVNDRVNEDVPPADPEPAKAEPVKPAEPQPAKTDAEPPAEPEREEPPPGGERTRPAAKEPSERSDAPETRATVKKPAVVVEDPFSPDRKPDVIGAKPRTEPDRKPAAANKPLFDPIIIKVPQTWIPAKTKGQNDPNAIKAEPEAEQSGGNVSAAVRNRVVKGKEIVTDQRCSLEVMPERVSLLNAGGSFGVQVIVTGEGSVDDVAATSSSENDLVVRADTETESVDGRRSYVIKSVSPKIGLFQVKFESPCGKKEVTVRVR